MVRLEIESYSSSLGGGQPPNRVQLHTWQTSLQT